MTLHHDHSEAWAFQSRLQIVAKSIAGWFHVRAETRRRRIIECQAIAHLRQLEPYQIVDAGIDWDSLHHPLARILQAHPGAMAGRPAGGNNVSQRRLNQF